MLNILIKANPSVGVAQTQRKFIQTIFFAASLLKFTVPVVSSMGEKEKEPWRQLESLWHVGSLASIRSNTQRKQVIFAPVLAQKRFIWFPPHNLKEILTSWKLYMHTYNHILLKLNLPTSCFCWGYSSCLILNRASAYTLSEHVSTWIMVLSVKAANVINVHFRIHRLLLYGLKYRVSKTTLCHPIKWSICSRREVGWSKALILHTDAHTCTILNIRIISNPHSWRDVSVLDTVDWSRRSRWLTHLRPLLKFGHAGTVRKPAPTAWPRACHICRHL